MDTTSNHYHSVSLTARTFRVLSQCISILFVSSLTKSLDDLLQTRITTTLCKLEQPQPQNSCKEIECSAEGRMYRDGYYIKPRSQRISILFVSYLTKSLDDPLQTRITTTLCKLEQPQPKNGCKDIECSAAGGMYRDGN